MKLIALTAALALGGTAIAQDVPGQTTTPGQSTPSTMQDSTNPPPTDSQDTTTGTTGAGTAEPAAPAAPTTGTMNTPGMPATPNTPATPADPMMPTTPGTTSGAAPMMGTPNGMAATPAPAAQANYPMCSRTVTDQCRQRGGR